MPNHQWTPEVICRVASKYKRLDDFKRAQPEAYRAAGQFGIKRKVCAHMKRRCVDYETTLAARIKRSDLVQLDRVAERLSMTRSQVFRAALNQFIEMYDDA